MSTDIRVQSNKRCIISLANERGNYYKGLERLEESLKGNFSGDFLGFRDEISVGAPSHLDVPYGFKVCAFEMALSMGYEVIMWLDCSVYAIANIDHLFDKIEEDGYLVQEAGQYVGNWTSDLALDYFGITRDEAMSMLMCGNAGMLGLDFTKDIAISFFKLWSQSMRDGAFKGAWSNDNKTESEDVRCWGSRHDMSANSIICNKLGIKFQKGNEILQYGLPEDKLNNTTIVLKAAGL